MGMGCSILWVYRTTHNSRSDLMEQIVVVVYLIGLLGVLVLLVNGEQNLCFTRACPSHLRERITRTDVPVLTMLPTPFTESPLSIYSRSCGRFRNEEVFYCGGGTERRTGASSGHGLGMIEGVDDSRLSAIGETCLNERENSGNQRKRLPAMFATSAPHTMTIFSGLESRASAAFFVSQQCLDANSMSCPKLMGKAVNAGDSGWICTFVHGSCVWDPSTTKHLPMAVPLHSTDSHPP